MKRSIDAASTPPSRAKCARVYGSRMQCLVPPREGPSPCSMDAELGVGRPCHARNKANERPYPSTASNLALKDSLCTCL